MRTQYPYDNLDWQEFERLVIELCQDLLGIAAKTFSDGKDGGLDSFFEGTAEKFPSASEPVLKVIIWLIVGAKAESSQAQQRLDEIVVIVHNLSLSAEQTRAKRRFFQQPIVV